MLGAATQVLDALIVGAPPAAALVAVAVLVTLAIYLDPRGVARQPPIGPELGRGHPPPGGVVTLVGGDRARPEQDPAF